MKPFYSHSKPAPDGTNKGVKFLTEHTGGVTENAVKSLHTQLNFGIEYSLREVVEQVCKYHDLGKYTSHFQNYLLKSGPFDVELKQHAKFGGFALYQKLAATGQSKLAIWAAYLIIHHHKSLSDISNLKEYVLDDSPEELIFKRQLQALNSDLEQISRELSEPKLESYLQYPDKKFRKLIREIEQKPDIHNYFLLNYLFSLLIEADKLDASDTVFYNRLRIPALLVENRVGEVRLPYYSPDQLSDLPQNELRTYVRGIVMGHLQHTDVLTYRLFTLTAPTGIGKTLTALDFALRLKAMVQGTEGYEPQIIYALPFINIIEQAIVEYTRVIGEQGRVLAHYQYADALEQLPNRKTNAEDEENRDWNQKTMLLDTWQCDIVITTFVQFLQTLIGNRNKLLKKFHHLAGAIVILDEVQTIRLEQLPLVGAALYYAAKFLNTRIILMTATKPKTFDLAYREILEKEGESLRTFELLTNAENVFAAFRRTKIVPLIERKITDEDQFVAEFFSAYWGPEKSCLVVCNLVKRSVNVFSAIEAYLSDQGYNNPVYYLSTNIVPVRRMDIIRQIRNDLTAGKKPVLVATQCVEAGVDLDFDMGFRDVGPVDSIIQVAGRINRENSVERRYSPLYIVDFDDCEKIYDRTTASQSRHALKSASENGGEIPEENYLLLISNYYDNLSAVGVKSFAAARNLFDSMKRLNYDNEDKDTYPISSFQVIDHKGYAVSVFIELDEEATEAKEKFTALMQKKIDKAEFEKHKLSFNQRIITVPKYLPKVAELQQGGKFNTLAEGLLLVNKQELSEYYNETIGFDRSKENASAAVAIIL